MALRAPFFFRLHTSQCKSSQPNYYIMQFVQLHHNYFISHSEFAVKGWLLSLHELDPLKSWWRSYFMLQRQRGWYSSLEKWKHMTQSSFMLTRTRWATLTTVPGNTAGLYHTISSLFTQPQLKNSAVHGENSFLIVIHFNCHNCHFKGSTSVVHLCGKLTQRLHFVCRFDMSTEVMSIFSLLWWKA